MTQATHTPAPWDWQDGRLIGDLNGDGGDVSFAAIGNARLIATAPDLLAALYEVLSLCDRDSDIGRVVITAINKAKGN